MIEMPTTCLDPEGTPDRITEVLARAWIECDPNREKNADEIIANLPGGSLQGEPRWKWFIPRAEAMRSFLSDHGLVIRPKETR